MSWPSGSAAAVADTPSRTQSGALHCSREVTSRFQRPPVLRSKLLLPLSAWARTIFVTRPSGGKQFYPGAPLLTVPETGVNVERRQRVRKKRPSSQLVRQPSPLRLPSSQHTIRVEIPTARAESTPPRCAGSS